ncbi:hypothetical protein [Nocardia camponoti]|uniref:Uncharacterized protein n=1 Tax=Nocardia camponoti TaxID=1616106 RepID=A0A917VE84_9NOCA|nr:hypothetical protein [Nocardia camponoti]GGK69511.1 hypothetical protein GCM10011591_47050 [Nocardia camponoti]
MNYAITLTGLAMVLGTVMASVAAMRASARPEPVPVRINDKR